MRIRYRLTRAHNASQSAALRQQWRQAMPLQAPENRKRSRSDLGGKISCAGIPPLHHRTTKLSAECLVQILHIIAEDGALQGQGVGQDLATIRWWSTLNYPWAIKGEKAACKPWITASGVSGALT